MTLPSFLQQAPPSVAVDISRTRVVLTRLDAGGKGPGTVSHAIEALPPGAVTGALATPNIANPGLVAAAIERAWPAVGGRSRRVGLVVPDSIARVSVVRFETIPARPADLDELVRWQIKKTTPFPLDEAAVAYTPGQKVDGGGEFVVTVARRDVLAQYEQACAMAGAHAGVVDLATFNVVNVVLASGRAPSGDWLLVHAADSYVSLAVLRDGQLIFYRTRGDDTDDGSVADLVHQTAMYYEDRLGGTRFNGVLLAGGATVEGADYVRRELSGRLGLDVVPVDPYRAARPSDRQRVGPEDADLVAAGVGMLCRLGQRA